jgi:hypothetical protein
MLDNTAVDGFYVVDSMPDFLSVSEITSQLRRRLGWYGLDGLALRTLARQRDGHFMAELAVGDEIVYRELIDGWTGRVRDREMLWPDTGAEPYSAG